MNQQLKKDYQNFNNEWWKILLVIALVVLICWASACHPPQKPVGYIKADSGHWEYTHDEEMKWVKDSTKTNR